MKIEIVKKVRENVRTHEKLFVHEIEFVNDGKIYEYHSPKETCKFFRENFYSKFNVLEHVLEVSKKEFVPEKKHIVVPIFENQTNIFKEDDKDDFATKKDKQRQRAITSQSATATAAQFLQGKNCSEEEFFDLANKIYWLNTNR